MTTDIISLFSYTSILIISIISLIILYFKHAFTYWSKLNVPTIPYEIPFGHFKKSILQIESFGENIKNLYTKLKQTGKSIHGLYMFLQPVLMITDPDIVKTITIKDFHSFESNARTENRKGNPLSQHLANTSGRKWKFLRSNLSPTFTSGKMKMMINILLNCGEELESELDKIETSFEVKETIAKFTTNIIGCCAFGIECNCFKDPDNVFRKHGEKLMGLSKMNAGKKLLLRFFPMLAKFLGLTRFSKDTVEFFVKLVRDTIDNREKNNIVRNDFLGLLLQLKLENDDQMNIITESEKLSFEQIAAQCILFYGAGFDTSSSALSYVMYELCENQHIQDKVRQEIYDMIKKNNGKITYDGIAELNYMSKVIDGNENVKKDYIVETLRLHTVAPVLVRQCTKDYEFDNGIQVKTGTNIFVSASGFHLDPDYYPNPEVFDPERFSPEEKAKRHPYVFLPFGIGSRNCIGFRFAYLEIKVGLIFLLKNYKYTLNSKTIVPLQIDPKSNPIAVNIGGIWVNKQKIQQY